LPFEPQIFGQAANNGQMINELGSKSKVAEGFQYLAEVITHRNRVEETKSSLLGPILQKLKRNKE
jgi:pilus assembly protein CpaE